ncbi:hypothetical protein HY968_02285 [Candidatus Kaiserbacteria bacterium]|nr:hypothetical protein [Candidatus Kaiserbacteria bacterium]
MHRHESPAIEIKLRLYLDIKDLSQKDAELLFEATRACLNGRTLLCKKKRDRAEHQCMLQEMILR